MIKLEKTEVLGWEAAIRGMRNPMNSWEKSDSKSRNCDKMECDDCMYHVKNDGLGLIPSQIHILGPNDKDLMTRLIKGGDDHGKVARYLDVYVDITAPLYFWKEFRTYRKGRKFMDDGDEFLDPDDFEMHIETNSCSTMHKIHEKEFTLEDFSTEHLGDPGIKVLKNTIKCMNDYRDEFIKDKEKHNWWQMIQLLPSSYNQKRTVKLNYQVLKNMYHARKNHKLDEWREFCKWIEELPYSELITGGEQE